MLFLWHLVYSRSDNFYGIMVILVWHLNKPCLLKCQLLCYHGYSWNAIKVKCIYSRNDYFYMMCGYSWNKLVWY